MGLSRYLLPGRPLGEKRDRSRLLRGAPERAPNSQRPAGFQTQACVEPRLSMSSVFQQVGGVAAPGKMRPRLFQRAGDRRNALSRTATKGNGSSVQASR